MVATKHKRLSYNEAAEILAARDKVLAKLIAEAGPMRIGRPKLSPFESLVQAIVYQQLAGGAARAIHGRLIDAMDGSVSCRRCWPFPTRHCGPSDSRRPRSAISVTWQRRC